MIAGLGNPGREYNDTPHNVGFAAVDSLCKRLNGEWRLEPHFKADVARVSYKGDQLLLVRPMTYMNASGEAVGSLMRYFKVPADDLTVITDDVNLPPGRIRVRTAGSAGGHNGLKSIIEHVDTQNFTRVRIGVGRGPEDAQNLIGHVLGRIAQADAQKVGDAVETAADAALCAVFEGKDKAMNRYNAQPAADIPPPAPQES